MAEEEYARIVKGSRDWLNSVFSDRNDVTL